MKLLFQDRNTNGLFVVSRFDKSLKGEGDLDGGNINTIVFNRIENQKVTIDGVAYTFPANSILPLVANQHFEFEDPEKLIAWQFNRDFYCIVDHDAEVGCVGFLFYGIRHPFFIPLAAKELANMILIERFCIEDMETRDRMQAEMLRTSLKRLIINVTRIAKSQTGNLELWSDERMDAVRMFNLLLESHFRTEHEVRFYAKKLNKSPKTLSNLFALFNYPPPSKVIQKRIILEAKRYLYYSDKTAKEISYSLGFTSPAHFSRFFKQHSGHNISRFREQEN
jgi:AraC family transcriptional regulator, transcriptional activator of pobA